MDSFTTDGLNRSPYRCQGGGKVAGEGNIVEADDSHILWNEASRPLKCSDRADRGIIVPCENRIEFKTIQQESLDRSEGILLIKSAQGNQLRVERDIVCLQCFSITAFTPNRILMPFWSP